MTTLVPAGSGGGGEGTERDRERKKTTWALDKHNNAIIGGGGGQDVEKWARPGTREVNENAHEAEM